MQLLAVAASRRPHFHTGRAISSPSSLVISTQPLVPRVRVAKPGEETPWEKKISKAFFRGSRTTSMRDPLVQVVHSHCFASSPSRARLLVCRCCFLGDHLFVGALLYIIHAAHQDKTGSGARSLYTKPGEQRGGHRVCARDLDGEALRVYSRTCIVFVLILQ
eukprot:COSAG01_NODE_13654_length_1552_cov_28.306263_4_plen_162_part_00